MAGDTKEIIWQATLEEEGRVEFRIGRAGDSLVAEWPGLAILRAHRTERSRELVFAEDVDPRWRDKLEKGLVRALLASLDGQITLHAAAVSDGQRAVVLAGPSGAGKSTLAAYLTQTQAFRLIADDTSPVLFEDDRILVEPADSEVWLWGSARAALGHGSQDATKKPVRLDRTVDRALPVAALVVLTFANVEAPTLRRLHGHDALAPLLAASLRFVLDERDMKLREIVDLERIAMRSPIYELARPRSFAMLGATADVVAGLLSGAFA